MVTVNLARAKPDLSELLEQVEVGQSVVIARRGRAVAQISPADRPGKPMPLRELAGFRADSPRLQHPGTESLREVRNEGL